MTRSSQHSQDKNAGNIGDLLKHFRLLELIGKVVETNSSSKVAYLESHAGAGWYPIDDPNDPLPIAEQKRIRAIGRDKKRVCADAKAWADFDRVNPRIHDGIYLGSFPMALKLLAEWKQAKVGRLIKALLWEKDSAVRARIQERCDELFPSSLDSLCVNFECSPPDFTKAIASLEKDGWTVIWLCDPYWGDSKDRDKEWFRLLDVQSGGHGLLFACVGGDSRFIGPDKFDYVKTLGAPGPPDFRIDDNVRSYGLYLSKEPREGCMATRYVLSEYVQQAMAEAGYDKLEDGTYAGHIPACQGVVAFGGSLRECEAELQSTLEDWILLGLRLAHPLPVLRGIDLNKEPAREPVDAM
ncbi:MAG: hypothetical protein ABSB82_01815 [Terriglobia bacterium]|jgi:predicted RNase H-like HicB family nuclease